MNSHTNSPQPEKTKTDAESRTLPQTRLNPNSTVGMILGEDFDVMVSVGGVRGIFEAILPTVVFLAGFVIAKDHLIPAILSLAVSAAFILVRLIQRIPISPAIGGLLAMVISVVLAWRTGEASNIFLWGILVNIAYFAVLAISAAVKWPLVGAAIAFAKGEGMGWRKRGVQPIMRRCYYRLTWLWVMVFALRLLVQLPLYFSGSTEALGIAKLAMGLPLFALAVWFSWLIYRSAEAMEAAAKSS
ncbi:DUF3159 domain-containing protein [Arcanobacterium hippocoleae]